MGRHDSALFAFRIGTAGGTSCHPTETIPPGQPTEELSMRDVIVEEVRRVREELIKSFGGINA
jgi:hypothetical protein